MRNEIEARGADKLQAATEQPTAVTASRWHANVDDAAQIAAHVIVASI